MDETKRVNQAHFTMRVTRVRHHRKVSCRCAAERGETRTCLVGWAKPTALLPIVAKAHLPCRVGEAHRLAADRGETRTCLVGWAKPTAVLPIVAKRARMKSIADVPILSRLVGHLIGLRRKTTMHSPTDFKTTAGLRRWRPPLAYRRESSNPSLPHRWPYVENGQAARVRGERRGVSAPWLFLRAVIPIQT